MHKTSLSNDTRICMRTSMFKSMLALASTIAAAGVASTAANASFTNYNFVATPITVSGQNLVRYEIFATFNGPTDTVLNVFNLALVSTADPDGYAGFWHKDNNDDAPGVLSQAAGTWAPQLIGSAVNNRPYDSYLSIGATSGATSSASADPSWNFGGSSAHAGDGRGWSRADLVNNGTIGWFNGSPPNLQGRAGINGNDATTVKVAQLVLSQGHAARTYSLRTAWNNGAGGSVQFSDGTFTLVSCAPTTWYLDLDADGVGLAADGTLEQCAQPTGYSAIDGDNCPNISNPSQADCDSDGVGDACRLAAGSSDLNSNGVPDDCSSEFVVGGSGYASIAAAISIAPDGTHIDVAAGNYGPIDLSGRALSIASIDGPSVTFIDGGNSSRPMTITSTNAEGSVIEGFTLRNGYATSGGGALISDATAYFSNCVWTANSATNDGGAVRVEGGAVTFADCTFTGNAATNGGAISIAVGATEGATTIEACTLSENIASELGGALHVTDSVMLIGSTVEFNVANSGSAGVDVQDAISATISDTQLCANEPTNLVGAVTGSANRFGRDCNANGLCDLDELNSTSDSDNDGTLDRCERALGDLNLDGIVNNYDLAAVLFYWGTANVAGDVDGNGSVTSTDLSILLANWGPLD